MNSSTPSLPVHHQLPEFIQTHVHRVSDAIQPSHPLSSPSLPDPNPSQHQSLFQWVNSSHEVVKVLEFQLYHHSFQRNPRADLLQNGLVALKHVKYHVWNELPVQVRCTILDAWGWCTGTTQRDGKGREEGGGFRMGNTCIPVVDSFWYLAKLIQLCKI